MKHFGKIISISAVSERSFTTSLGEQRSTTEMGVVIGDGIDVGYFELADDNARSFGKLVENGDVKTGDLVVVDFYITDSVSKEKDTHFTHLKVRRISKLCSVPSASLRGENKKGGAA